MCTNVLCLIMYIFQVVSVLFCFRVTECAAITVSWLLTKRLYLNYGVLSLLNFTKRHTTLRSTSFVVMHGFLIFSSNLLMSKSTEYLEYWQWLRGQSRKNRTESTHAVHFVIYCKLLLWVIWKKTSVQLLHLLVKPGILIFDTLQHFKNIS